MNHKYSTMALMLILAIFIISILVYSETGVNGLGVGGFLTKWVNDTYLDATIIKQENNNSFIINSSGIYINSSVDGARINLFPPINNAGGNLLIGSNSTQGVNIWMKAGDSGIYIGGGNSSNNYDLETTDISFMEQTHFGDLQTYFDKQGSLNFVNGALAYINGADLGGSFCKSGCTIFMDTTPGNLNVESHIVVDGVSEVYGALRDDDFLSISTTTNEQKVINSVGARNTNTSLCLATSWYTSKYSLGQNVDKFCIYTDNGNVHDSEIRIYLNNTEKFRMSENGKIYLFNGTASGWLSYNGSCIISSNGGCI